MGSMSVSSCRCVHHVAVLNVVFCMTCSLLMLVEDESGDHMDSNGTLTRGGAVTAVCQTLCKLCRPSRPQQW